MCAEILWSAHAVRKTHALQVGARKLLTLQQKGDPVPSYVTPVRRPDNSGLRRSTYRCGPDAGFGPPALTCLSCKPNMIGKDRLMVGQKLGHYRFLEQVGSGGMGVVYRARDEQLERDVALKVLPSGALSDEASGRLFRKEALALAKISHPNIETIYEFNLRRLAEPRISHAPPAHSQKRLRATLIFAPLLIALIAGVGYWLRERRAGEIAALRQPVRSIAIFPFRNAGLDKEYDYFGVGLADVLNAELTNAGIVEVHAILLSINPAGWNADPAEMVRKLGVDAILSGSYQIEQGKLSLRYTLLDLRRDVQIAGKDFQAPFTRSKKLEESTSFFERALRKRVESCEVI